MHLRPIYLALMTVASTGLFACGGSDSPNDAGTNADASVMCQDDDGCPTDQFCDATSMTCQPGTGNECEMDMECGDGRACNTAVTDCGLMRCRNVCEAISCADHSECGTWVCLEGTCAEPPSCAGAACPAGLVCNTDQVCEPAATCADDTECTSPQICAAGICQDAVSCADSTQCPSGLVCQEGTCDDPCAADADCGDPNRFTCDTTAGLCRQRCLDDSNCAFGSICESLVCLPAECTVDSECTGAMEECQDEENGHGRCVVVTACTMDSECPDNFTCTNMTCVELPPCRGDRECQGDAYCEDRHCQPADPCNNGMCPAGQACIGDRCVPSVCRGPADCPNAGEVCVAGECVPAPAASAVTEIRILTPAGTVGYTATYAFTAVALDASGDIVPGVNFDWSSSDEAVATIDAAGLATALSLAGSTDIMASLDNGSMTVASAPVSLTVIAAAANVFQVTVTDERSGAAVSGVTVQCDAETGTTDMAGQATFPNPGLKTCTVFSANHDYLTVVGLTGTEAHLKLSGLSRTDRSTGYTGMVDTSFVTSPVRLSFSGGSFGSPLFGFSPANILGGDVFNFSVPVVGTVAFPSGATASAEIMGFPLDLKSTFYAQTDAGTRRAWTFAGGAEINDLGLNNGALLSNILPLLQTFVHGGSTGLETLVDLPYVVDSGDIDGDGDTTEMLPDYNAFVPKSTVPTQSQRLRFAVEGSAATLPTGANSVMMVSGVLLPSVGFVPLGLDGISEPNGAIGRFITGMAPAYAGLEAGHYAVLIAAVNIVPDELPSVGSARLFVSPSLPTEVDLGAGWLAYPNASFDETQRTLTVPATTGADMWRAHFAGPTGGWRVFAASSATDFALPAVPMGMDDRSAGGTLNMEMVDLQPNVTLDALFGLGTNALTFDMSTAGFSQQRVR